MQTASLMLPAPRARLRNRATRESEAVLHSNDREADVLASRLIAAQESERRRIARELHDNVGQKLALLCMDIESLRAHTSAMPGEIAEAIARLSTRAMDISSDVHCLSHDLHPPTLELLGLSEGIARLCHDLANRSSVRIDFRRGVERPRLSADASLCLFRVAQEALQNVVKHSGARAVTVHLTQALHNIRLDITDDGKGFVVGSSRAGAGLGLWSMRERVLTAGGRIAIQSALGQGTRVSVTLPTAPPLSARQMS